MDFAAQIVQINTSPGGVPKRGVGRSTVGFRGLVNDDQADKEHHGSPEQALCLYSLDLIMALQVEGHPIFAGSTGENLTVAGLDWRQMVPGEQFKIGHDIIIEITDDATPCSTIAGSFKRGEFKRISEKVNPGWSRWYAKVLQGGEVMVGDSIFRLREEQRLVL
jgi:MOSC domain-containing protein YiiM